MGTQTQHRNPGRLTAAEAKRPITGCTCGKCGRTDAVIYPWETRGILVCAHCSPLWLSRWMREWAAREGLVAA